MAQQPLAHKGNFLHIYDFRVSAGHEKEFIRLFGEFDYSDGNPMHKSSAQVKDGVLCRDTEDPDRFYIIGERRSVEQNRAILKQIASKVQPKFLSVLEKPLSPTYGKVASSTPAEYLAKVKKQQAK